MKGWVEFMLDVDPPRKILVKVSAIVSVSETSEFKERSPTYVISKDATRIELATGEGYTVVGSYEEIMIKIQDVILWKVLTEMEAANL